MDSIKCIAAFAVGFTIGSVIGWKMYEKKSEEIIKKEIEETRAYFNQREKDGDISDEKVSVEENPETRAKVEEAKEKPSIIEYATKLNDEVYTNYSTINESSKEDPDKPYVIAPEEYGEYEDYEQISLTYFGDDGVLTDDQFEIVEDIANTVGFESLGTFGEYEDDSVFVRNDSKKCDYEILWDGRKYREALKERPHYIVQEE